jgi:hypothetical protein
MRPHSGLIEPDPIDARDYRSPDDSARTAAKVGPQLALHVHPQGRTVSSGVPYSPSADWVSVPPYSGRFLMPSRVRHLE